jgi:hypothetical protein
MAQKPKVEIKLFWVLLLIIAIIGFLLAWLLPTMG